MIQWTSETGWRVVLGKDAVRQQAATVARLTGTRLPLSHFKKPKDGSGVPAGDQGEELPGRRVGTM